MAKKHVNAHRTSLTRAQMFVKSRLELSAISRRDASYAGIQANTVEAARASGKGITRVLHLMGS
jgi:hypothetical protein